jgi:Cu(I)/Ag(I) efflux system protein CusF
MEATMKRLAVALSALAALTAPAARAQPVTTANAASPPNPTAGKVATGTGVVVEVDAKAGAVTIRHQPIPALGWPAMTMPFYASKLSLLDGLKPGQKITFQTREGPAGAELIAITGR